MSIQSIKLHRPAKIATLECMNTPESKKASIVVADAPDFVWSLFSDFLPLIFDPETTLQWMQVYTSAEVALRRGEAFSAADLAVHLDRPYSTIKKYVDDQVKGGFYRLERDDHDGRRQIIRLTRKGQRRAHARAHKYIDWYTDQLRRLHTLMLDAGITERDSSLRDFIDDVEPTIREAIDRYLG